MSDILDREIKVLEAIVRNYILTAAPTGSRYLSKQDGFKLSSATIRNVMGDLEDKGYIEQPHTSAGRIPTDKGYRFYVNRLNSMLDLPSQVKEQIRSELTDVEPSDLHMLLEVTSRALSKATNQLGIILSPNLCNGTFRHLHIYPISPSRFLINLTIDSGFVKSLIVEVSCELDPNIVDIACRIINERFSGMQLQEIFFSEGNILNDASIAQIGVIRFFVPSIKKMLDGDDSEEVFTEGQTNILLKPEFFGRDKVNSIIEILDEKKLLMHMFNENGGDDNCVAVSIGGEIEDGQFRSFSIVKTSYTVGNMCGTLGVIGPRRMPYPYLISAVDYTAKLLSSMYSSET